MQPHSYQAGVNNHVPQPALTSGAQSTVTFHCCKGTTADSHSADLSASMCKDASILLHSSGCRGGSSPPREPGLMIMFLLAVSRQLCPLPHLDGAGVLQRLTVTPPCLADPSLDLTHKLVIGPLPALQQSSVHSSHTFAETQPLHLPCPAFAKSIHYSTPVARSHFCDPREMTGLQCTDFSFHLAICHPCCVFVCT